VYSVRPTSEATVSAPVTWSEIEDGIEIRDFRIDNMVERQRRTGDLWAALASPRGRFPLQRLL
jgi:bifunctional non-homologous end joining protein LigD